jgi:hypothetical protein
MKGLELAEKYFEAVGRPMLESSFRDCMDRISAGLVGDGSECFGFDDEISRDHDWGPSFCVWLSPGDFHTFGARLQASLDTLPGTFLGYGPRQESRWGEGRVGVFETGKFYRRFIGLERAPSDLNEWLLLPENALAACTNGKVFTDLPGEFTRFRETLLAFYPEDVRKKKIAARCMTLGQAGQYNFPRCVRRGEPFAARYAETKFCADFLSVVFLLNRRYTPFYKWMHRAVRDLPLLGPWAHEEISALTGETDASEKEDRIERMCGALIREFARQGLSHGESSFVPDHGPLIQGGIEDRDLRERNVWVG